MHATTWNLVLIFLRHFTVTTKVKAYILLCSIKKKKHFEAIVYFFSFFPFQQKMRQTTNVMFYWINKARSKHCKVPVVISPKQSEKPWTNEINKLGKNEQQLQLNPMKVRKLEVANLCSKWNPNGDSVWWSEARHYTFYQQELFIKVLLNSHTHTHPLRWRRRCRWLLYCSVAETHTRSL